MSSTMEAKEEAGSTTSKTRQCQAVTRMTKAENSVKSLGEKSWAELRSCELSDGESATQKSGAERRERGLNSASTWEQEGHWVECRENRWKVGVLEGMGGMGEVKGLGGPDKEIGFYQSHTSF